MSTRKAGLSAGVSFPDPELAPPRRGWRKEPWPERPAEELLARGAPLGVVLHQAIRGALYRSLALNVQAPVRATLAGPRTPGVVGDGLPVCWYGHHDASWVAGYDALARLGLATYSPAAAAHLAHWSALTRSCGWWWPGRDVCVVVDRPRNVAVQPARGPGTRRCASSRTVSATETASAAGTARPDLPVGPPLR